MFARSRRFVLVPLIAVLGCTAQESASTSDSEKASEDPAAVRQAIDAINANLEAAFEAGDATAAAANYASDAVVLAPNGPAMVGNSGIVEGLGGMFSELTVTDLSLTTTDVMVAGDLAVETGTYSFTMQPKGGAVMTDKGKFVTVLKKQADGSWKLVRDIWNTDTPLPPAK